MKYEHKEARERRRAAGERKVGGEVCFSARATTNARKRNGLREQRSQKLGRGRKTADRSTFESIPLSPLSTPFFPEEAVVFPDKREHMNDLSGRSKVVQQISSGESTPPSIYPPRGQERGLVATRTSKMAGERERERERVVQAFSNL